MTDILIRFAWVIYLIPGPASSLTKVFIIALLEMFRRWQWNTFRLENEHLVRFNPMRCEIRVLPLASYQ